MNTQMLDAATLEREQEKINAAIRNAAVRGDAAEIQRLQDRAAILPALIVGAKERRVRGELAAASALRKDAQERQATIQATLIGMDAEVADIRATLAAAVNRREAEYTEARSVGYEIDGFTRQVEEAQRALAALTVAPAPPPRLAQTSPPGFGAGRVQIVTHDWSGVGTVRDVTRQ